MLHFLYGSARRKVERISFAFPCRHPFSLIQYPHRRICQPAFLQRHL